ncbi:hypothetical protein [Paenibacillus sp. A14]|uniref:hypothetical protein n=1 Tax=Paenibacillus sp. A14 TaxID=3119820 RepID=UPI002FE0CFFA
MAKKEVIDLDFEMDSRELDQADKKLRSLDKLLQQTQRRASVLGKTKIAPKITLEDRFSAAADKVERRLSKLKRMTVSPIVGLTDGVTAAAARIRASLLGLTGAPWRIRVEGVDWDGVVGGSFSNWMGSKGKETLQQISSSIGSSLGGGLKDMMMGALGLADAPKEVIPIRWLNLVEEDRKLLKENNESPYAVAGRKAGETFFQAFLSTIDSKEIADKLSESLGEKTDKKTKWEEEALDIAKDIGVSLFSSWLGVKIDKWSNKTGQKIVSDLSSATQKNVTEKKVPNKPSSNKTGNSVTETKKSIVEKGAKSKGPAEVPGAKKLQLTSKELELFGNISKTALKVAAPLGLALDTYMIATSNPGKDRAETVGATAGSWAGLWAGSWAGASIGAALTSLWGGAQLGATAGSVVPGPGTVIGGAVGGVAGMLGLSAVGKSIGGFLYEEHKAYLNRREISRQWDTFYRLKKRAEERKKQGLTGPLVEGPSYMGPLGVSYNDDGSIAAIDPSRMSPEQLALVQKQLASSKQQQVTVNVNMSSGMINLNNKEEIDVDNIVYLTGLRIKEAIQKAQQNLK